MSGYRSRAPALAPPDHQRQWRWWSRRLMLLAVGTVVAIFGLSACMLAALEAGVSPFIALAAFLPLRIAFAVGVWWATLPAPQQIGGSAGARRLLRIAAVLWVALPVDVFQLLIFLALVAHAASLANSTGLSRIRSALVAIGWVTCVLHLPTTPESGAALVAVGQSWSVRLVTWTAIALTAVLIAQLSRELSPRRTTTWVCPRTGEVASVVEPKGCAARVSIHQRAVLREARWQAERPELERWLEDAGFVRAASSPAAPLRGS